MSTSCTWGDTRKNYRAIGSAYVSGYAAAQNGAPDGASFCNVVYGNPAQRQVCMGGFRSFGDCMGGPPDVVPPDVTDPDDTEVVIPLPPDETDTTQPGGNGNGNGASMYSRFTRRYTR